MGVSRLVYEETGEVFYSKNVFSLMHILNKITALEFLRSRPAESRLHIRSIVLMIDDDEKYNTAAHNYLEQACLFLAENSIHIRDLGLWLEVSRSRRASKA
jgi:hypothetical protein